MPSLFAWVDFAEEDRRKMAEVIDLFREQDTRDEVGLEAIRDGLADLMFPGTSTIQTRARYFLFVPWIYRRHEGKATTGTDVSKKARTDEIKLIDALVIGGERDGVIGIEKRAQLQRLASSIYWAGLGVLRVRRFVGSQDQYHRSWDSLLRRKRSVALDDDREPVDGAGVASWAPELPELKRSRSRSSCQMRRCSGYWVSCRAAGEGRAACEAVVGHHGLDLAWKGHGPTRSPIPERRAELWSRIRSGLGSALAIGTRQY
jgi:hypothetical protein